VAINTDRYNAKAHVNKANCVFVKGKLDEAKELYMEALSSESDCIEALYNLGMYRSGMATKFFGPFAHCMRVHLCRVGPQETKTK
jgi:hypothetical protein